MIPWLLLWFVLLGSGARLGPHPDFMACEAAMHDQHDVPACIWEASHE